MGTRALIHVIDKGTTICTIYSQYDGYPEGIGSEIFEILGHRQLVNDIPGGADRNTVVNGMGDAAALLVAYLKKELQPGGIYLYVPNTKDVWEEYTYFLSEVGGLIHLELHEGEEKSFNGPLCNFTTWLESELN